MRGLESTLGTVGTVQGVADREPLRLGMRKKSTFESQTETAYVSVLQDPLHTGEEQRILNSSFLRGCFW